MPKSRCYSTEIAIDTVRPHRISLQRASMGRKFAPKGSKTAIFRGFRPHCYIMATMGLKLPFTSTLTLRNAHFRGKKIIILETAKVSRIYPSTSIPDPGQRHRKLATVEQRRRPVRTALPLGDMREET